jgi:hypothetical protein
MAKQERWHEFGGIQSLIYDLTLIVYYSANPVIPAAVDARPPMKFLRRDCRRAFWRDEEAASTMPLFAAPGA